MTDRWLLRRKQTQHAISLFDIKLRYSPVPNNPFFVKVRSWLRNWTSRTILVHGIVAHYARYVLVLLVGAFQGCLVITLAPTKGLGGCQVAEFESFGFGVYYCWMALTYLILNLFRLVIALQQILAPLFCLVIALHISLHWISRKYEHLRSPIAIFQLLELRLSVLEVHSFGQYDSCTHNLVNKVKLVVEFARGELPLCESEQVWLVCFNFNFWGYPYAFHHVNQIAACKIVFTDLHLYTVRFEQFLYVRKIGELLIMLNEALHQRLIVTFDRVGAKDVIVI